MAKSKFHKLRKIFGSGFLQRCAVWNVYLRVLHSLSRLRTLLKWNEDGGLSENMNFQESRFNIEQSARNPFCKFRKSAFYGKTIGWGCRIGIVPVTRKYVSVAAHPFTLGTTNRMQGNTNKYKYKYKCKY